MIVKCEQCQTRFKIPDEKVSDKGVKVRCTKCQNTFRVMRPASVAEPARVDDPFASFAAASEPHSGEATRPVYFPQGVAATRQASGQLAPSQWNAADSSVDDDIFREPTRIGPLPVGLESPSSSGVFTMPGLPSGEGDPAWASPPSGLVSADPFGSFDFSSADTSVHGPPPLPAPPQSAPYLMSRTIETPATQPSSSSLLGDLPPFEAELDDGFQGREEARSLFDMPARRPAPAPERVVESLDMSEVPMASAPSLTVIRPDEPVERHRPLQTTSALGQVGAGRRLAGVAVQLIVGGALVLALILVGSAHSNGGKLSLGALSLGKLEELIFPSTPWVASDLSNGLYETVTGRAVFFVRGVAENHSGAATPVKVHVALYEGDQRVRTASGLAGKAPTPEDLHQLTNRASVAALRARLDASSAPIAPGEQGPFLVVFDEYPPDLTGFRVVITFEPVRAGVSAER